MKSDETPLEQQIERSLAALEAYSEVWILEHLRMGHATTAEDMMFWKERDGRSMWLDLIQIRSTLLLARAIARQNARPRITNHVDEPVRTTHRSLAERRLLAAKEALVKTGYFKPEEVGDDIAPRILEMWFNKEDQHD